MAGFLLYGGSFNPIHHGHLIVARSVAEQRAFSRVVLIPSRRPPHKRDDELAPAEARLALCHVAVEGDSLFEVSDWEMQQSGPNYTLTTVRHFRALYPPPARLAWLIGMDSLAELATWHRVAELLAECEMLTAQRPASALPSLDPLRPLVSPAALERLQANILETPRIDVGATQIRARVAAGRSIRYLVPERVREEIERRGLYRA